MGEVYKARDQKRGWEGKTNYAVTELPEGETLRGRLAEGAVPWCTHLMFCPCWAAAYSVHACCSCR